MIAFIGNDEKAYFVEEVARTQSMNITYINSAANIQSQIYSILQVQPCKYMIFDIEQYENDAPLIAQTIQSIQNTNNAMAIILASGYLQNARILIQLRELGFFNIITATDPFYLKDQFIKCISGFYEKNPDLIEIKKADTKDNKEEHKLIAVAGSCHRIGTTTTALQLVKYLNFKGYKAAYIQMNNSNYIQNLIEWFEIEHDPEMGKVSYQNIDQFYRLDRISQVLRLNYDYFVYDYATYTDQDFNKMSFLEKDMRFFVVGASPNEMPHTLDVIQSSFYQDVNYIYNFVPEADWEEIYELMEEKANHTFFTGYAPDPYTLTDLLLYEKILPLEDKAEEQRKEKKTKKRFWRK